MKKEEISKSIDPLYPNVYGPTFVPKNLKFNSSSIIVGYFEYTDKSPMLEKENKYTFIELRNAEEYKRTKDEKYITIVDGNLLIGID